MMEFTAEMIAGFLGGDIVGNKDAKVHTVSSIEEGRAGSLAYLTNPKYEPFLYTTGASIVLVDRAFEPSQPVAATLVKVDDAGACVLKLLEMYNAAKPRRKGDQRPRIGLGTGAGRPGVLHRRFRGRRGGRRHRRGLPDLPPGLRGPRRPGSATTPRSTPESKSTKAASWVRTASSTQGR